MYINSFIAKYWQVHICRMLFIKATSESRQIHLQLHATSHPLSSYIYNNTRRNIKCKTHIETISTRHYLVTRSYSKHTNISKPQKQEQSVCRVFRRRQSHFVIRTYLRGGKKTKKRSIARYETCRRQQISIDCLNYIKPFFLADVRWA